MVLKSVPSSGTRVEVEELQQEEAILDCENVKYKVELQTKLLRSDSRLESLIILSDVVHTRVEVHKMDSELCGLVE